MRVYDVAIYPLKTAKKKFGGWLVDCVTSCRGIKGESVENITLEITFKELYQLGIAFCVISPLSGICKIVRTHPDTRSEYFKVYNRNHLVKLLNLST